MSEHKNHTKIYILLFVIILVLVLLFSFFYRAKPRPAPPVVRVNALKLEYSNIPIQREYIGITKSIASVKLRARVEGFLEQMLFVEGKPVKKGQVLFVIDKRPFEAQLKEAEGSLKRAQADLAFQRVQYIRMRDLVRKGDISQSYYDEVEAKYKSAQGAIETATGQVEVAKLNLSYCTVVAPFDGLIGKKYVDVGNLVSSTQNTELANVVRLNPIYVELSPSVADYGLFLKYRKNMPFKAKVTLPLHKDVVFDGEVNMINNEAEIATSTILMRVVIDNPDQLLRPGIYVNVHLEVTDKQPAILIPSEAIMEVQGQRSVFAINADNKIEVKPIEVDGQYQQAYVVKSGVNVDDIIVINNLQKIFPGFSVLPTLVSLEQINPALSKKPADSQKKTDSHLSIHSDTLALQSAF